MRGKLEPDYSADVLYPLQRFYEVFPDEFDYLVFLTEVEKPSAAAWGVYSTVNHPGIPGYGSGKKFTKEGSPSQRVYAAISEQLGPEGPTLHEIAHHWCNWLERDLIHYIGHWQYAGVYGRLGGFDPETLFCATPEGTRPPCEPDDAGITSYVVDDFNLLSNRSIPYAPLELYLMGLLPPEEVPPVPILLDVVSDEKRPDSKRLIRAESMRVFTVDDIIEVHGLRPLATDEERIFRTAYVLVTPEEPTEEQIEIADNWVQEISCQKPVTKTKYCFEEATRRLATMKVDLPDPHAK